MSAPRTAPLLALAGILAVIASCTSRSQIGTTVGGAAQSRSDVRWVANLTPRNGTTVTGTATVTPTTDPRRTQVVISVQGAAPSANLPWHIHLGNCSNDLGIYGPANSYPMLGTAADGRAQLQVELLVEAPAIGSYMVNVHRSPTDMGVVACGELIAR